MDDLSSTRYAHSDGHTDICFDESGAHLVTCGTDGDIRIWNGFDDDDPQSQNMGKVVTAVALKNKLLYVATDAFSVSSYTFPEIEFESIIAQYNSDVYHIACNDDGNLIASGGGDFIIKVYDASNKSLTAFRGHDGPVKSIAFDSKGKYMASSGCDGCVRIWVLTDQECVKTLNILKKSNDMSVSCPLNRLCWSPDGQYIAIPVENEVRLYIRETWESVFTLKDDCIVQDVSIVAFSPFGNYIAAAAMNGQMIVWDFTKKSCLSRKLHENELAVCGFAWNPSGKDIVFCDIEGQLGLYERPFAALHDQVAKVSRKDIPIDFECDDDGKDMDDMDINDLDLLHDKDEDDDNAFDIGAIKATLEPKIFGEDDDAVENESVKSEIVQPKVQVIEAPKPLVQTAFQPSSTPIHLERRFMLWNTVGIVRCYNTDEENSIDVEFHDANVYHPLHINNTRNHTLAALSTEALLLSSPKADENSSKLECLHFGTWDLNKEWIMEMPMNEDIESVALGEGFAVCITDNRLIRIFTISGVQCEVISLPGPVVCSSAREKQIAVAYHKGLGIENDQNLNLMLIDVKLGGHCIIKDYPLPLSPKAFLSWLGYTDEGHPCIVDTSGTVNLLTINCGMKWIPIANTKNNLKGISDTYFVIGLSEIKQEIRCILCKGARYPSLLPKPNVAVIPFSLPFCEMSSDKGRLEEENRRCSIVYKLLEALLKEGFDLDSEYNTVEKKWMDILLKMFALATRTDREYRALDVAGLMPNTVVIQGAIKYATQRHKIALAERLGEVMNKKLLGNDEETECDTFSEYESLNFSQNTSHSNSFRLKNSEEDSIILKPKPLSQSKYESPRSTENSESLLLSGKKLNSGSHENSLLQSKASPVSNPFKASSKSKAAKIDNGCSSDIDSILDNSMRNLNNKSNSSTLVAKPTKKTKSQEQQIQTKLSNFTPQEQAQTKLNNLQSEPQLKKFGFQLFLEQNRDSILCSSESELSEGELIRTAMKLYKELPASEKEKYAKQNNEVQMNGTNGVHCDKPNEDSPSMENSVVDPVASTNDTSKRKSNCEMEDNIPMPKKLKNTSSKLSETTTKKLTQFAFTKNKISK